MKNILKLAAKAALGLYAFAFGKKLLEDAAQEGRKLFN